MKPYDQNIVTFEAMFLGYSEAVDRFDAASKAHDPITAYVPLSEALSWAYALDDRTAAHFAPEGKSLGFGWRRRRRIPSAELMGGVRYARNRVHHQWSDAMELRAFPGQPLQFAEWVWRPAEELPQPGRKPHPADAKVYCDHMEGRPVTVCLHVLGGVS
jgi:hypothetical protein